MQEKEIFAQMLTDFAATRPEITDNQVLQDFCDYAKTWFSEKGVVGVAQTVNGFALRFKDGSERILFSSNFQAVADQPSFSISGVGGGPVRITPIAVDTSHKITG
jgi:hypothetical protein